MTVIKKNLLYSIKKFHLKSIFFKNLIFYTLIIMLPVLVLSFFYCSDIKKNTVSEIEKLNMVGLRTVYDTTDAIINEMKMVAYNLCTNSDTAIFSASKNSDFNNYTLWKKIKENNISFKNVYGYIDSVYIYSEEQNCIIYDEGYTDFSHFQDTSWYAEYSALSYDETYVYLRYKNENNYPSFITVLQPINFAKKKTGAVVININIENLTSLKGYNVINGNGIVISDGKGNVYYSKNILVHENTKSDDIKKWKKITENNLSEITINGKNSYVSAIKSQTGDIYYISLLEKSICEEKISSVRRKTYCFIILFLFLGICLAVYMTYFSVKPINTIVDFIENSQYDEQINTTATDELNYIIQYAQELLRYKNDTKNKLALNNINLKKAYNLALQSQISPHFLCNTLEVINWKSVELNGGDNVVSQMIGNLGEIYNYLLKVNNFNVTIKEEMAYTKLYSEILEFRYQNKFEIIYNINPDIMHYRILKLTIQPILENAVCHGIQPMRKKGIIKINGDLNGDCITFSIEDNGVGMDKEKLDKLRKEVNKNFDIFEEHIGIANVYQRMKMVYRDNFGLTIDSKPGEGTKVTIIFPKNL